jgi:hypothetical protein
MSHQILTLAEKNRKLSKILSASGDLGKIAVQKANGFPPDKRYAFLCEQIERVRAKRLAPDGTYLDRPIVDIRTFMVSPEYLNAGDRLWPRVLEAAEEMNNGLYTEAVLTGAIGSAKTTLALYSQAYQLYVLSCYTNPHRPFDLDPTSEIEIIFQSLNRQLAADVDFERFKAIIDESPYFTKTFTYDHSIKTKLIFPKRIIVRPITGESTGAIGQNVIGGIIDEINFMAQVEKSKKNPDGGTYDQAVENYNAIARRRESRFMKAGGFLPGLLCVVSSARYKGQFTDRKKQQVADDKKDGKQTRVFLYDKRMWDVAPESRFCGDTFPVFPGNDLRKPYIVEGDIIAPKVDVPHLINIPTEFLDSFRADILNSLRDIAGISTTAIHPFILEPEKVAQCFDQHPSIFSRDDCDFDQTRVMIDPDMLFFPQEPRWIHVDLAATRDSCGIAVGCVSQFKDVSRGAESEIWPVIHIDGILEIKPPRGGEILFADVRRVIYALEKAKVNIRWVTFDQWQSRDSQQQMVQKGYTTGEISMDRTMDPYEILKGALYDGRCFIPRCDKALQELVELEVDVTKGRGGKIDHRPNGSKDCSDALAGVVYGLSRRRDLWAKFGVAQSRVPVALRRSRGGELTGR